MLDITEHITVWVKCCKDVWSNWFKCKENGEGEFCEVEEALFSALVLSEIGIAYRPRLNECWPLLRGVYRIDVASERSICRRQKAGNIFCQSKKIVYRKEASLPIRSIDFLGTMLDGEPYAELMIDDKEFILEPLINLNIMIGV